MEALYLRERMIREAEAQGLIARHRGENIVRRWSDEVIAIKADHAKEVSDLKKRLDKYGGHNWDCDRYQAAMNSKSECTCGWDAK